MKSVGFNKKQPLGHKSAQSWRNTHISKYYGITNIIYLIGGDYTSDSSLALKRTLLMLSPSLHFSCLMLFFYSNVSYYSSTKNVECKFHVNLKELTKTLLPPEQMFKLALFFWSICWGVRTSPHSLIRNISDAFFPLWLQTRKQGVRESAWIQTNWSISLNV